MKKKILVVVSKYNKVIGNKLEKSTINELRKEKLIDKYFIEAPGAFEIPSIIAKHIKNFDGVIALGCIIKGETNNFDLISQSITNSIMKLSIDHKKPIGNGIISCFNIDQATKRVNKGAEAALAVINILKVSKPIKIK